MKNVILSVPWLAPFHFCHFFRTSVEMEVQPFLKRWNPWSNEKPYWPWMLSNGPWVMQGPELLANRAAQSIVDKMELLPSTCDKSRKGDLTLALLPILCYGTHIMGKETQGFSASSLYHCSAPLRSYWFGFGRKQLISLFTCQLNIRQHGSCLHSPMLFLYLLFQSPLQIWMAPFLGHPLQRPSRHCDLLLAANPSQILMDLSTWLQWSVFLRLPSNPGSSKRQ